MNTTPSTTKNIMQRFNAQKAKILAAGQNVERINNSTPAQLMRVCSTYLNDISETQTLLDALQNGELASVTNELLAKDSASAKNLILLQCQIETGLGHVLATLTLLASKLDITDFLEFFEGINIGGEPVNENQNG